MPEAVITYTNVLPFPRNARTKTIAALAYMPRMPRMPADPALAACKAFMRAHQACFAPTRPGSVSDSESCRLVNVWNRKLDTVRKTQATTLSGVLAQVRAEIMTLEMDGVPEMLIHSVTKAAERYALMAPQETGHAHRRAE